MSYKLLINGALVDGAAPSFDVINPATEEVLAQCPKADIDQLEEAVAAAKAAFPSWAARPIGERAALLNKLADAIEAKQDEFSRVLTEEQGKPLPFAAAEVAGSISNIRYFASLQIPRNVLVDDGKSKIIQHYTPLGVVAAITPWNFPLLLVIMKLAPALMAGNTLVAKPAPTTPLTMLKLGELCAGIFPAGVVNVIADQNDLGGALTGHKDVAKIAFTGSTATGKKVMASASSALKRITLELGGNDAAIVLEGADIAQVAPQVLFGATFNSGQVCLAIKRLYVHDSQYDAMCDELARLAKDVIVDDGLKQGTTMGPLQNKAQYDKVLAYIEDGRTHGKIIAGGETLDRKGYFVPPTIVRDIPDDAKLVREEQFGPVLPVLRYEDLDEVIARANDSDYGLGGSVWGSDSEKALETALKIDSGTVWVNKFLELPNEIPFAGSKQSGIGVENGLDGLLEFTQAKIVNMAV